MFNTPDTISIAEISQYLWADAISNENQLMGGSINNGKAMQLYMERSALQYGYAQNLSGVEGVTNYVYALCGAQLQRAIEIFGTGAGGGSVVPGGGGYFAVQEFSGNAVGGSLTISFPEAIGKRLVNAFRQANNIGTIKTSGTPTGEQVVWNSESATLTVASDRAFWAQEFVRIVVQQ